jgi:hypothetical protein
MEEGGWETEWETETETFDGLGFCCVLLDAGLFKNTVIAPLSFLDGPGGPGHLSKN